ncbi:ROK family protein [Thiospirochaeta perfilievii]|uniref:ROK family protein n=1 Tax=Thiospirochaeta perfilievii TaxID=252967 RepID=A0A5C1Q6D5_9SPIO|nr:ROK family transcriptional regulator [Thiospirochaeta perfilievii]QEN03633.1 ROK family protein [Thiospirochaeta perfilievii]
MKASNKSFQRQHNLALVARSIWKSEGISRVDISKDIEMDKTSVSNIVSVLLENNLIEVANVGESMPKGGRKPINLRIKADFGYVLGLNIQPDKCKLAILCLDGSVVFKEEIKLHEILTLDEIVTLAIERVRSDFEGVKKILGCTIGLPGNVDTSSGTIIKSDPFKIFDYEIGNKLQELYKFPFLIENDANCCAWGEIFFNNDRDGNFLFLLGELNKHYLVHNIEVGIGFGMGIVIDNKVYPGFNNQSGEFKSLFWRSKDDYQFGSDKAKRSFSRLQGVLTDEVLEELLLNFTPIISVLNPERVVVGGDVSRYTDRINALIETEYSDHYISKEISGCNFVRSNFGEYDVAVGSACMFLEKLFRVPEISEVDSICDINWENIFS